MVPPRLAVVDDADADAAGSGRPATVSLERRPRAASETAERGDDAGIDVVGGVNHDRPRERVVIDTAIEADEPEREAVSADVGLAGDEGAKARLVAAGVVREMRGLVSAAVPAVRHERVRQYRIAIEIKHPEPLLARQLAVVDDGKQRAGAAASGHHPFMGLDRALEHTGAEPGGGRRAHQFAGEDGVIGAGAVADRHRSRLDAGCSPDRWNCCAQKGGCNRTKKSSCHYALTSLPESHGKLPGKLGSKARTGEALWRFRCETG